jgi:hypothetical protein
VRAAGSCASASPWVKTTSTLDTAVATLAHEVEQMKVQQAVEKYDGDEGRTMTRLVAGRGRLGSPGRQGRQELFFLQFSNCIQLRRSASTDLYLQSFFQTLRRSGELLPLFRVCSRLGAPQAPQGS